MIQNYQKKNITVHSLIITLGTVLVTLDISAAFDCIRHDILLRRLEFTFGVTSRVLTWFQSWPFTVREDSGCGLRHTWIGNWCAPGFMFRALPLLCVHVDSGKCHPRRRLFPSICGRCSTVLRYQGISVSGWCTNSWTMHNSDWKMVSFQRNAFERRQVRFCCPVHGLPSDLVVKVAGCSI